MMKRWMVLIVVMAGLAVLGAACEEDTEDGTATAGPTTDAGLLPPTSTSLPPTVEEVSDADLWRMVLPQEEFGPQYSGFTLDVERFGLGENEDEIAADCDPEEMRRLIESSGRTNAWEQTYRDEEATRSGTGASSVGSVVTLFQDAEGAEAFFQAELEQLREGVGVPDCDDFTLFELEEFAPGSVGGTAVGLVVFAGDEDVQIYATTVWFVRANLYAFVGILHVNDEDHRAEAEELARQLDSRIEAVLRGESP